MHVQRVHQTVFIPEATSDLLNVCFLSLQHILIVQRQLTVLEEELDEFRLALRQYMECACAQTGCLQSVHILFHYFRFVFFDYIMLFVLVRLSKVYPSYLRVQQPVPCIGYHFITGNLKMYSSKSSFTSKYYCCKRKRKTTHSQNMSSYFLFRIMLKNGK